MRALLTPEVVPRLGVVLLKPGKELMPLFSTGRVLVESEPESMGKLSSGRIPDARQPVAEDESLVSFFTYDRVIQAAGGLSGLDNWLERNVKSCQYPHSEYHHLELVNMRHTPGALRVCWHCDNTLRDQTTERLAGIASRNVINWVIDTVLLSLRANRERELSIAELCWWAVSVGVADAIPDSMAARALRLPYEPFPAVYRESDIVAADDRPSLALQKKASKVCSVPVEHEQPKVLALRTDPESPESFMLRPKRRRWSCTDYTRWVKAQSCSGCRRPADDPHHVLGHGLGGTATKAHDLFVIPLCRECHDKLHADAAAFEKKHGTQLELLFRFLDRVLAIGVIVKA
ncbi:DUF968 domain-containing protein [Escherichia sp. E1130]|uniref:DUF968 domain-containing protein n=1 Tax=Escherichia sp. E1130 TaxID=2041645 RepID=UPI0010FEF0CC|nr:DUF968 domain-containing protein [Escherichia sp. E1130]TLI63231.1 DUF968 domain-containing protein [Escherichia sp. E1130]